MNRKVPGVYNLKMSKGFPVAIDLFGEHPGKDNYDPDQSRLIIDLPTPPNKKDILNYNLPTAKQKFYPPKLPYEYHQLTIESGGSRDLIYRKIWSNPKKYETLIRFVEQEWERRINGVWFYNNGFPVYMSGTHYFYCGYWPIDVGLPGFRDRDWVSFLFWDRVVVPDPLSLGEIYMKHRREGATYRAQCKVYEYVSRIENAYGGIQSKTESDPKKVFLHHLIYPWKRLPWFFKPIYDGTSDPQSILKFVEPGLRGKMGSDKIANPVALSSQIDFENSKPEAYDSRKLHRYHLDESGKMTDHDVRQTWRIAKTCLTTGAGGKASLTSTVAEMLKGGGRNFKYLWEGSDYGKRMETGKTVTGLYRFFLPAKLGLELENVTFVDEYGVSDHEKADEYPIANEKGLKENGDIVGLNEWKRQYPRNVRMAFRSGMSNDLFNGEIIQRRLEHYVFGNQDVKTGYFERINPLDWRDGVRFVPDKDSERFRISMEPELKYRNAMKKVGEWVIPSNTDQFIAGGDPFKYDVTQGTRRSDGGLAIKSKRNSLIDPDDKPVDEHITGRFALDYLYRPTTVDEFCEDCLLACVYYGCKIFPEINISAIWDYFIKQGAAGYLFFTRDERNRLKTTPGANTRSALVEKMFGLMARHIEEYGTSEKHDRLLEQCNEVSVDTITDYDLFTAAGYALVGESYDRSVPTRKEEKKQEDEERQKRLDASFPYEVYVHH